MAPVNINNQGLRIFDFLGCSMVWNNGVLVLVIVVHANLVKLGALDKGTFFLFNGAMICTGQ